MRVSKQQAAENRSKIVTAAAQLLRENGIAGIGVDALTAAAGLSHGSVYSQFGSKERLVEEALEAAMQASHAAMDARAGLAAIIKGYLSPEHRDAPGQGCTLAALGCEVARQPAGVRDRFTQGLRAFIALVRARIGTPARSEDAAIAVVSSLVGAMVLARAVHDPRLSDRILEANRKVLLAASART